MYLRTLWSGQSALPSMALRVASSPPICPGQQLAQMQSLNSSRPARVASGAGTRCVAPADYHRRKPADCLQSMKKVGPLPAALLNASYVQGFELDGEASPQVIMIRQCQVIDEARFIDFHKTSPNHGASLLMPSLVALAEHEAKNGGSCTWPETIGCVSAPETLNRIKNEPSLARSSCSPWL